MDCIIYSDQAGSKLTLVTARLTKPTSPSFASQAPAPRFWWAPSIEQLPSCAGVQFHTLSSGHLLKILLHIIRKAHLGLCLLLPLQTLPIIPTRAFAPSGSLGQQSILFPLSIPCPHEATGREQINSLSSATLQLSLKSIFGLKNTLRTNINFIKLNFLTSCCQLYLSQTWYISIARELYPSCPTP